MKKQVRYFIFSMLVFGLALTGGCAQAVRGILGGSQTAAKFGGVYAGVQLFPGINGMDLYTYTYYFRPDGTFATELDKPDWKTRVDGTYTVKGKTVTALEKKDKKPDTLEIQDDGSLERGGAVLQRFPIANSVPAKRLEHKSASSSGGLSTGNVVPYVGVFSNRVFIFDGQGNFSNDASSTVAVSGENIGGGANNNKKSGGTYTIKDSVLTLKYRDGTVVTKSFFYNDGKSGKEVAALIDGDFYFEFKPDGGTSAAKVEKKKEAPTEAAPDGMSVLRQANLAHGGAKLDNLHTLKITGKLTGANGAVNHDVVILYDFVRQKIRTEFLRDGKYDAVDQFDGEANFSWKNGQQSPLAASRTAEMKESFATGVFGLRSDVLRSVEVRSVKIDQEKNLKTLRISINGKEYGWIFDAENRLVAEASVENNVRKVDLSSDFRPVDGILFPFSNSSKIGSLNLELKLTAVETNPNLTEKDWAVPR